MESRSSIRSSSDAIHVELYTGRVMRNALMAEYTEAVRMGEMVPQTDD